MEHQTAPILTYVLTSNFLFLLLYLGCTTNRSVPFEYLHKLLDRGH